MSWRRAHDWSLPALGAVVAALGFSFGLVLALRGGFGEPLGPAVASAQAHTAKLPRDRAAFRIVGLGDSITAGTGNPDGGYGARLADRLRAKGRQVTFINLAVPGAETAETLAAAAAPEAQRQLAEADLIVVSAAANDLTHALRSARGDEISAPKEVLGHARENLRLLLARLRTANRHASIRLLGLYNPFEMLPEQAPQARAQLLEWNLAIEQATTSYDDDVLVVPLADLFAGRPDRLARDSYHPGPAGHGLIADRVAATLRDPEPPR